MLLRVYLVLCMAALIAPLGAHAQDASSTAPAAEPTEDVVSQPAAYSPRVELSIRLWNTNFDADSTLVREIGGGRVELADELGMDTGSIPEIRLRWRLSEHHSLIASYLGFDESGDQALIRPLVINGGLTAPIGSLEADLSLDYYRIGWRWEVAGRNSDKFDLETILDVAVFDVDATYRHYGLFLPVLLVREDNFSGTLPLPLIGLRAEYRPAKWIGVYGEIAGMFAGNYGNIIDTEAGLRGYLGKHVTAEAGYRYFAITGSDDEDSADVKLSGPYFGMGVRF